MAEYLQQNINPNRKTKKISNELYMYNKIKADTLLIECGFISNPIDRKNLTNETYQKEYAKKLTKQIIEFFKQQ